MGSHLRPDVVVAADGRSTSGLGHLSRAGALVAALRTHDVSVLAIALGASEPVDHEVGWLPESALSAPRGGGAVVVDAYDRDVRWARSLSGEAAAVVVFGDDDGRTDGADLAVSVAGARSSARRSLLGPAYACLRSEFWSIEPRPISSDVRSVLVAAGATAAPVEIARAVSAVEPEWRVRVVAGEDDLGDDLEPVVGARSLLAELLAADLVVTAAGQTLLESLATGTPTITFVLAENQRRQAELVAHEQAACFVDPADPQAIATTVESLAGAVVSRRALGAEGRRLVDGGGAHRVADAVIELLEDRSS